MKCEITKGRLIVTSDNSVHVFNEVERKKGSAQVCCDSEMCVITYKKDRKPLFDLMICKKHAPVPYEVAEILYLRPVYVFAFTSRSAYVHGCVICDKEDVFTLCIDCIEKMVLGLYGKIGKLVESNNESKN